MKKRTTLILILLALLIPCLSLAAADSWNLYLPESLTEIGEYAFAEDTSLDSVYVGDMVESIGSQAFANSSLRDIRLPESLTEIAPDAFMNVPHVEVYGTWNPDFFDGMDNVSMSGSELPANETTFVAVAAGQEVFRKIPITMTGKWYFGVENCSGAALYNSEGDKIADLKFGEFAYFVYQTFSETDEVFLSIRNDMDALTSAKVYIESPFQVDGIVSMQQAERKSSASLLNLYYPSVSFLLEKLDAHQYYSPSVRTTFDGDEGDYVIDLYVDDIPVKHWEGTFSSKTQDFLLEPEDVMKFGGFDEGEYSVRIVANGSVTEYTYTLNGTRKLQSIGQKASSLYILPEQHVFASFTADSAGVYTIRSNIPVAMQIYGRLIDEDGNVLDSKEEDNEEFDFFLSANLAEGQTVTLEAWLASQENAKNPFYGVVELIVNNPYAVGYDIFKNAQCRALVIGETYENSPDWITRLDGCRKDADCMTAMLSSLAGTPYSVAEYIDMHADEILAAIPAAFAGATEDDVSLFYYSGHGATGSGALLGSDGEEVTPEVLKAALDSVPGTKIILLDSCFSGYFIGRDPEDAANAQAALDHFMSVFSFTGRGAGSEYYVLTASSMYETSIGYRGYCSLFTGNLLEGMGFDPDNNGARMANGPADANEDGMFTLNELLVYCRNEIRDTMLGQTVCPWPYNCNQVLFIDEVPER